MNLENKKELAKKVLRVGKNRIIFSPEGLSEIKEAITKQDIKTLYQEGIITIKPVKGRRTVKKRKTKRGPGKIRKTVGNRKQDYVKLTRKLRAYLKILKNEGKINRDLYIDLRKKIKIRYFKDKAHLKDYLENEVKSKISGEKAKEKKTAKPKKSKEIKK
jgi:large subunit ribosomal protein L19e